MNLFVDDVRTPPPGWELARTVAQAKNIIRMGNVRRLSLDYDLGAEPSSVLPPEVRERAKGDSHDGSGGDLARWMVEAGLVPDQVRVHSHNPDGAREIADVLAGHAQVDILPYEYGS